MLSNGSELRQLSDRWSDGKYKAVLEALENVLPQDEWMDMCDTIVHPADKKLANDLRGISLCEKDLKNLDISSSFLDFAVFDRSSFDGAQFQGSLMSGASFRVCKFRSAQLIIISGEEIDFSHAEFEKSHIDHAQLKRSNFSHVAMQGGNLTNSNVTNSDFSAVLVEKGKIRWNDARNCNFSAARFIDCDLTGSQLNEGRLVGAEFQNCDLSGVDFRGAMLERVRFDGGTFGNVPQGSVMAQTKFDDTPEARRAIALSSAEKQDCIEWCSLVPDTNAPVLASFSSRLKGNPGEIVPQSGWWVSPALGAEQGRRYFEAGQKFPDTEMTDWGRVIWSYNPNDQV
ncbi:pentapeptide repeat-containing protein [Paraburkholderia sediminicola]|uniref:pentapeptide repeat-containing protein n=1 Tax=Paraburkholderia sediminicola TaxID=458836 RepID=UPI0038B9A56C